MTRVTQHSRLIITPGATSEAERRIQDWMADHAGKEKDLAKKTITVQGRERPHYVKDRLTIAATTADARRFTRRCSGYSVHYLPEGAQHQSYVAYAVIIFPHETLGPGAAAITIHQPSAPWGENAPPWLEERTDPTASIDEIFEFVTRQDARQRRKGRTDYKEFRFRNLQEARQANTPVILITPKGDQDQKFNKLHQQYREAATIAYISETDQLTMSAEIPDDSLRQWLSAKAALVKDCLETVPDNHPIQIFQDYDPLSPVLDSINEHFSHTLHNMAHRSIMETLLDTINDCNAMQTLMEEAGRLDPQGLQAASFRVLNDTRIEALTPPETEQPAPEKDKADVQAQQRISTLEDQLQQEKERGAKLTEEVQDLRSQLKGYEQYLEQETKEKDDQQPARRETAKSREEAVMEAMTKPGRFPNLRFLNTATKALTNYGRTRPRGSEIITALDNINALAGLYIKSQNGSVGSWKEHFNLPGWAYANSESETTMGKHLKSRTFRDQDKDRQVVVQRHLTYRGSNSGLQIFFDADGEGEPFIVAYIGEHLPYASERT